MSPGRLKRAARGALYRVLSVRAVREALRPLVMARAVPFAVSRHFGFTGVFEFTLPGGEGFRYEGLPEDLLGRALYWGGLTYWEPETLRAASVIARRARDFWDVGANTGPYTLLASAVNPGITTWAFEPVPAVFARLRANVALNGWAPRCHLLDVAVGRTAGPARLHVPAGPVLPTSATVDARGFRGIRGSLVEVRTIRLADVIDEDTPVDWVKIDVEGYEDAVLEGMGDALGRRRPAIIVECIPDGPGARVERILRRFGYRFFHLTAAGPVEQVGIRPDPAEVFRNFLCVPEAKLSWIG